MIDPLRHLSVFSPTAFGNKRVDVVGCGATGSKIVMSLAKLGIVNMHIHDFDKVEEHNIPNQVFGAPHIGQFKVDALADLVKAYTGTTVTKHNDKVTGKEPLGNVVFVLTDTMASRKEIWDNAIKNKIQTNLLVETRMGAAEGRIYSVNPCKPVHQRGYEKTLCADEEVTEASACGASISVGPTADLITGLAVWQMVRWFAINQGADEELENETIFALRPTFFQTRSFK